MWTWSTLMQQWQFVHFPEHLSRWPWAIKQSLLSSPVTLLEETASLSTRLLLHFLLDSIAVVGGVTAAINWGLLFSLFSITVLFWTLLVWFPLCRNKAGQNTYFIFLRVTPILYMLLKYTWPLQHHATTTICQATKLKHSHHRSTKHQISSSWQIQFMTQHAKLQSAKGREQCRGPFKGQTTLM